MSSWFSPWSNHIKKIACRYLLHRYLGKYIQEKLGFEQLDIDIYNGKVSVSDVSLDCEALNEVGDSQGWPLEIVDGHVAEITVTIPWSTPLTVDSVVEVRGLSLTVQPKVMTDPASSMIEDMCMTTSMMLAEECIKENEPESRTIEGIEALSSAIDSIIRRIKVRFIDTKIRMEHVPKQSERGIAVDVHIEYMAYSGDESVEAHPEESDSESDAARTDSPTYKKIFKCTGISVYSDEFHSKLRTMSRSLYSSMDKSASTEMAGSETEHNINVQFQSTTSDIFYDSNFKSTISEPSGSVYEEPSTPESEEEVLPTTRILIAKLEGENQMVVTMQPTYDEQESPKIEIDFEFGSLITFLSPRQMHIVMDLIDAFQKPQTEDTSNIPTRPKNHRPMTAADYQIIENQLLADKLEARNRMMDCWSGPGAEEEDDLKFYPMTSHVPDAMSDSCTSDGNSMSTSMTSGLTFMSANQYNQASRRSKKSLRTEGDPTAEISHVSIQIKSVVCVLLHKQVILPVKPHTNELDRSTVAKMQTLSRNFFERMPSGPIDFALAMAAVENSVDRNHLRIALREVSLNGNEKCTQRMCVRSCEVAVGGALVQEGLYEPPQAPLTRDIIKFDLNNSSESSLAMQHCIKLNYKQTARYTRLGGQKRPDRPDVDITVKCAPCHLELDLTLLERMSASVYGGSERQPAAAAEPDPSPPPHPGRKNFTLYCTNMRVALRFPIADLRERDPRECDARNIRPDFLAFNFKNVTMSSNRTAGKQPQAQPAPIALKCTQLSLDYHETEISTPIHIAEATYDDSSNETHFPTITLKFGPSESSTSSYEQFYNSNVTDSMTTSVYMMTKLRKSEPSPFSGIKSGHQSMIKKIQSDKDRDQNIVDGDENRHEKQESQHEHDLIIPGNEEEMLEFTTSSSDLSKIHLDFDLPILSVQMESKHLYEVIYNRINSDLLLWEPHIVDDYELIDDSEPQTFTRCRSQSQEDAWEQEESESVGYDAFSGEELPPEESTDTLHHKFCLTFKAHKGLLTIYTPVRDNNKKVVPGQVGELALELNAVSLCHVSGVRAAPRSALFGLRVRRATLYHNPILAVSEKRSRVRLYGTTLPSCLKKIIYPSSQKVFLADKDLNLDNFVLALKMSPDAAETNRKHMCLSLGLQQCTVRHRGAEGLAWLHHFLDVIDVEDYPVPGYTPSAVVTEMHFNIVDCALDYRPLYLPLRTLVTVGDAYICNNIVQSSRASCFKLIGQECALFLAYVFDAGGAPPDERASPDVRSRDYVCVADTDLIELNARVDQKRKAEERPAQPLVEIGACSSKVTLHTCWDSATALGQLIAYVSAGGDARAPGDLPSRHTSVSSDHDETLIGLDNKYGEQSEPSRNEIEQMYKLMEEALKESPHNTNTNAQARSTSKETDEDVYLFPDELNQQQMEALSEAIDDSDADGLTRDSKGQPMNPQVAADLGVPSTSRTRREAPRRTATDEGYCLVEPIKEEKLRDDLNPSSKSQIPYSLGISDKFANKPNMKADVLKAPAGYPVPVNRFTLFEMNVYWHVYGGNDFRRPPPVVKPQKTVTIDDRIRSPLGVAVSWRAGSERVTHARVPRPLPPPGPARSPRLTARQRAALLASGGRHRDPAQCVIHCLHKLKYVQEKYPAGGRHAARQVLAVGRVEVLDRMRCSAINKLLTCYRLDHEPARDNAHMLVVKAAYMRMSPTLPIQECSAKVSMMPLRFHFDQDTITFLGNFFYKLGDDINAPEDGEQAGAAAGAGAGAGAGAAGAGGGSKQPSPTHRPPVISVGDSLRDPLPDPDTLTDAQALQLENLNPAEPALLELLTARRLLSENLIQLEEDYKLNEERDPPADEGPADAEVEDEMPVFFRRVVYKPEVPIQLDYVAKRVDMNSGPFIGLLMGLANLKCSELKLKAFDNRQGILGTQKLLKWMVQHWLDDIKKNQLGGLMQGVGPMHTIRELLLGFRDLLVMPLEQWQRDGRLMLGLRRGAASFSARTAVAALDITTQLLRIIQATAEMVMQNPPLPQGQGQGQGQGEAGAGAAGAAGSAHPSRARRKPKRRSRPKDLRDGMQTAYQTVKEGIAETAAMVARCEGGMGVLRTLPGAAVAPLKVAAEGAADVLGGVRAHLAPHARRDDADKWRDHDDDAPQH